MAAVQQITQVLDGFEPDARARVLRFVTFRYADGRPARASAQPAAEARPAGVGDEFAH